jgi:hypothetical protein
MTSTSVSLEELKASLDLASVAEEFGVRMQPDGLEWVGLCPFHNDSTPSFHTFTGDDGVQRFGCFPCGIAGDVFDFVQKIADLSFPDALERLRDLQGDGKVTAPPVLTEEQKRGIFAPPPDLVAYVSEARARFKLETLVTMLCDRGVRADPAWIADEFEIGISGTGSLTIPHRACDDSVAAVKTRYQAGDGWVKRAVRGSKLTALYGEWRTTGAQEVFICEGETDTWTVAHLLRDQEVDVYGLPGGVKPPRPEWLELLRGKDVTLVFDADEPGVNCAAVWANALVGVARHVGVARLPEGKDASSVSQAVLVRALRDAAPVANVIAEHVLTFAEMMRISPPAWQVEGLIQDAPQTLIYAHRASFKSFLAIDLALHCALGKPWHGRSTQKERVLYVAAEGTGGIGARMQGWAKAHETVDVPDFFLYPRAVNFTKAPQVQALKEYAAEHGITLVVLDTLRKSMSGGDENSATDVGLVLSAAGEMHAECGTSVWIIHHTARAGNARGSTVIEDDVDNILKLVRDKDGPNPMTALLTDEKTKDAAEEEGLVLTLAPVEFLDLTTGEAGSTLVISGVEATTEAKETMRSSRDVGAVQALVAVTTGSDLAPTDADHAAAEHAGLPRAAVRKARERYTEAGLFVVETQGKRKCLRATAGLVWALR